MIQLGPDDDEYFEYRRQLMGNAIQEGVIPESPALESAAPPDMIASLRDASRRSKVDQLPWYLQAEAVRRGLTNSLWGLGEAASQDAVGLAGATFHGIGDRISNLQSSFAQGLYGPPAPTSEEEKRKLYEEYPNPAQALGEGARRVWERSALRQNPAQALGRTGRYLWEGLKPDIGGWPWGHVQPPNPEIFQFDPDQLRTPDSLRLDQHGSWGDYVAKRTGDTGLAVPSELVGTFPAAELIGLGAMKGLAPPAKMVGRAMEPLRQVPLIQRGMQALSVAGDVRAFEPTQRITEEMRQQLSYNVLTGTFTPTNPMPLWFRQLVQDYRDPKLWSYVWRGLPDEMNLRETLRYHGARGGGVAALAGVERSETGEPAFLKLREKFMDRYGLDQEDAGELVGEFIEEANRNPHWRSGWSLEEHQAFRALKGYLEHYQNKAANIGIRGTQLHNKIERWAGRAEKKYDRLERLQTDYDNVNDALIQAQTELRLLPSRPNRVMSRLMIDAREKEIQDRIAALNIHKGEVRAGMEQAHYELQAAFDRFNELSWGLLGDPHLIARNPAKGFEYNVYDIDQAMNAIRERSGAFVEFRPRRPTGRRRRYMGSNPKGTGPVGDLTSNLGAERTADPKLTTMQLEDMYRSEAEWRKFTDPSAPFEKHYEDFVKAMIGRVPDSKAYEPFAATLIDYGLARDRALAHAWTVREVLNDPLIVRTKNSAPQGWIPIGVRGKDTSKEALAGLLSAFEDDVATQLRGKYVSPETFRFLEYQQTPYIANAYRGLGKVLPTINHAFKPWVTIIRPEFWTRNFAWSLYAQTSRGNWDPANYLLGAATAFRRGGNQIVEAGRYGRKTMDEVYGMFVKNRIINGAESSLIAGTDAFRQGKLMSELGANYQGIEDALRAAYGWHLLRQGKTLREIQKEVRNVMFNYGPESMTNFDRWFRDVGMPFWGWTRAIPRLTGRDFGERPQALGRLAQFQDAMFTQADMKPEDEALLRRQPDMSERLGFPVGRPGTGPGSPIQVGNLSSIGYTDLSQWALRSGHESDVIGPFIGILDAFMANTGPLTSALYSIPTARRANSGSEIRATQQVPQWAADVGLPGVTRDPETGYATAPGIIDIGLRSIPNVPNLPSNLMSRDLGAQEAGRKWLTGWPVQTRSMDQLRRRDAVADRVIRKKVMGQRWDEVFLNRRLKEQKEFQDALRSADDTRPWRGYPAPDSTPTDAEDMDYDEYRRRLMEE